MAKCIRKNVYRKAIKNIKYSKKNMKIVSYDRMLYLVAYLAPHTIKKKLSYVLGETAPTFLNFLFCVQW